MALLMHARARFAGKMRPCTERKGAFSVVVIVLIGTLSVFFGPTKTLGAIDDRDVGAPNWPFTGIYVPVIGSSSPEILRSLFWNTGANSLHFVHLRTVHGYCGIRFHLASDMQIYLSAIGLEEQDYLIPWGDDAYPVVAFRGTDRSYPSGMMAPGTGGYSSTAPRLRFEQREREPSGLRFQLSIGEDAAQYRITNLEIERLSLSDLTRDTTEASREGDAFDEAMPPPGGIWSVGYVQGEEGRLFGLGFAFDDMDLPCQTPGLSVVYDGRTGLTVACHSGGLLFFDSSESPRVGNPVLPEGIAINDCPMLSTFVDDIAAFRRTVEKLTEAANETHS